MHIYLPHLQCPEVSLTDMFQLVKSADAILMLLTGLESPCIQITWNPVGIWFFSTQQTTVTFKQAQTTGILIWDGIAMAMEGQRMYKNDYIF